MTWILFALLSALATGCSDAVSKFLLQKDDEFIVAWLSVVFIVPLSLIGLFLTRPLQVEAGFWQVALILIPLEIFAFLAYLKALRLSPLTLTLPFLSFTPVFVIVTSRLILGEKISALGMAGVALVVLGSYWLNINEVKKGFFAPWLAIGREAGSRWMFLVAFIYGINVVLGKQMIILSDPNFFALVFPLIIFFGLTPFLLFRLKSGQSKFNLNPGRLGLYCLAAIFLGLTIIGHFNAVSMTYAAYAISLKRTSILFGSLMGLVFFKEKNAFSRLVGIGIMLAGVFVIGFYA
ncbi:MAG: DMT family transporter [Candidatus Margulisiibacteriota bacterium]